MGYRYRALSIFSKRTRVYEGLYKDLLWAEVCILAPDLVVARLDEERGQRRVTFGNFGAYFVNRMLGGG